MRTSDEKTLHGSLELYDEAIGIAIVTSVSSKCVYTMDTTDHSLNSELIAFGCATNGTLMGANCSNPVFTDEGLVLDCKITEVHSWICFLTFT